MTYRKDYYLKNREKLMENQRRYRSKPEVRERYLKDARQRSKKWYAIEGNRLKRYEYNHAYWLRHIKKMEEIAGRPRPEICELCGEKGVIVFDHCHQSGKFRGWICERCNTVLGKVKDNKNLLQSLSNYLSAK